ncbi:hypothetical protein A6770_33660 [Nostoc minutum NIES-26]|uniref:DUF1330 domain-containing protein n=1 Tax=Nostoc minutum NIES-26 TaxID=1844469 RepID=A0A367Q0T5_9NOSO|nr:hypothetical protein A6770_33660 [Nostoc minutum NIES-26]
MPVCFVVYLNITDPVRFAEYFQTVMPVIQRRGGRLIAQGIPEVIEGTMTWKQAVVFEWSSREDFLSYWHSDEYAEIKQLRKGTVEFQAAIVEGVRSPS